MLSPAIDVFDAQVVQRLRELDPQGKTGLLERVYRTFDSSLRELLGRLLQAHSQGDASAMRHAAHSLKSSCASVGALRLAALAAEIEAAARAGTPRPEQIDLDGFRREADRVLGSLAVLLASR